MFLLASGVLGDSGTATTGLLVEGVEGGDCLAVVLAEVDDAGFLLLLLLMLLL